MGFKKELSLHIDDIKQFKRELRNVISIHTNINLSMIEQREQVISLFISELLKIGGTV